MKKIASISLLIIVFISCNKSPDLEGTWIEIDNYNNPAVFKYWDGKFYQYDGIYQDTVNYKTVGNKIIYDKHGIATFQLEKDILSFSFDSVTYPLKFERLKFKSYQDYLLNKLDILIGLPKYSSQQIDYRSFNNFVTLNQNQDSLIFSFNGRLYDLKDFSLKYEQYEWNHKLNLFLIDSSVRMEYVDYLEEVFKELNLPKIAYVTNNMCENGLTDIYGVKRYLPMYQANHKRLETDSDYIEKPIPPPEIEIKSILNDSKVVLYEFKNRTIKKNGKILTNELGNDIKRLILTNKAEVFLYHFDKECTYSEFIENYVSMNNALSLIRDSISILKFNHDYTSLTYEEKKNIRRLYPHRFIEISIEELEMIKNNP